MAEVIHLDRTPTDPAFTDPEPERCPLCLGPIGDDTRRCERKRGHDEPHLIAGAEYVEGRPYR